MIKRQNPMISDCLLVFPAVMSAEFEPFMAKAVNPALRERGGGWGGGGRDGEERRRVI